MWHTEDITETSNCIAWLEILGWKRHKTGSAGVTHNQVCPALAVWWGHQLQLAFVTLHVNYFSFSFLGFDSITIFLLKWFSWLSLQAAIWEMVSQENVQMRWRKKEVKIISILRKEWQEYVVVLGNLMKYVFQFLPSVSAEGRQKISSLARWTSATLRSTITSTKLFSKSETTERPSTSSANTKADNEHQCKFLPIYGNVCTVISHETKWRSQFRTHLSTTILFEFALKYQTSHNLTSEVLNPHNFSFRQWALRMLSTNSVFVILNIQIWVDT